MMTLLVASCTPLDLVKQGLGLGTQSGISVDAQVGDREINTEIDTGDSSEINASEIENVNYISEERDNTLLIIAIIGWMAPDPVRIWTWFTNLFKFRKRK